MGTIDHYYFKGRMDGCRPRVHECAETGISIDLYHFEGDGLPVCDGLKPCTITYDDNSQDVGWLYCMCYDPCEEQTPLIFLFESGSNIDDLELDPDDVPEEVLGNILTWLEAELQSNERPINRANDVTSFFYYMWNRWSEEECKIVFKNGTAEWQHFWRKWCEAYDMMKGPRGAAEFFYAHLSDTNRELLVRRALEVYNGHKEK